MVEHDNSYKLLFSHVEMVRDLLLGFVKEEWVDGLDLKSLEKVNSSYVSDDIRDRHDDIVWRVKWGREWLYVYILIEFQSSIDIYMPLRVMVYLGLLYQDLIREKKLGPSGKLPPVLPIVLYNGKPRWDQSIEMEDLIEDVRGGLSRYRPRFTFLLLDEGVYGDEYLKPHKNLVSALFRLENTRDPEKIREVVILLLEWLAAPEQASLRRAFTVWFNRVFFPSRGKKMKAAEFEDLTEVRAMLSETVAEWKEEWKKEGRNEGRKEGRNEGRKEGRNEGRNEGRTEGRTEGRKEGRTEGEANLLLKQLELKFGKLSLEDREKVQSANSTTLLKWAEKILTVGTMDEVFKS